MKDNLTIRDKVKNIGQQIVDTTKTVGAIYLIFAGIPIGLAELSDRLFNESNYQRKEIAKLVKYAHPEQIGYVRIVSLGGVERAIMLNLKDGTSKEFRDDLRIGFIEYDEKTKRYGPTKFWRYETRH